MKYPLCALVALVCCWHIASAQVFSSITPIPSPAGPGSAQPFLTAGNNGDVLLSWMEPDSNSHRFLFASHRGGAWTQPRLIARSRHFFLNWADVPSIYRHPDGFLAAHWLEKNGPGTYAYDVRIRTSSDNGRTWSPSVKAHRDSARAEHGFLSFFASSSNAGYVWLDGRNMAEGHDGHGEGSMALMTAAINGNGGMQKEVVLDDRVCECCPTSAAQTSSGVIVAYRNRSDEEVRDIAVVRWADGKWSQPALVHEDDWQIPGCPVNGPSVVAKDSTAAVTWFTAADGQARVMTAFSHDEGRSFSNPVRIDAGNPIGRVASVMLDDGSIIAMWLEYGEESGSLVARRVQADGTLSDIQMITPVATERSSGYPRIIRTGNHAVVAWTESRDGKKQVLLAEAVLW